jgi:hypothetical protein
MRFTIPFFQKKFLSMPFAMLSVLIPLSALHAQRTDPVSDSLKAVTLRNEKMYRLLNSMDDKGSSYEFTNVTAWKITDPDLYAQIEKVYRAKYGEKELKDFDVQSIYVFVAPTTGDRFQPFHILFMGKKVSTDTSDAGDFEFGTRRKSKGGQVVPRAFKGKEVIRTMQQNPSLMDNINAVQGEIVELPGDIAPRGVQLIKSADERYIFHQMFTGFYSKRTIISEQDLALGIPTPDEAEAPVVDSNAAVMPTEADETVMLSAEELNSRAFRYEKTLDMSIDHIAVNVSRQNELEFEIGNPEVGLPFWSSGEASLLLNMRNQIGTESDFKIGFDFPNFDLGNINGAVFQPRELSGFYGGTVAAYFAGIDFFSAFNMPIAFNFSFYPASGANSSIIYNGAGGTTSGQTGTASTTAVATNVPANRTFYRTAFIGQLYIPFIVQLDPANFVQFSAGVGVDEVRLSWIPKNDSEGTAYGYGAGSGGTVQDLLYNGKTNVSTPFTPHVAIEYVNHRSNKFGLDFQYDHLFTFGGWLELIPDHLRLEASYTAPLVRDPLPYEPPYFFEITPRIYF